MRACDKLMIDDQLIFAKTDGRQILCVIGVYIILPLGTHREAKA